MPGASWSQLREGDEVVLTGMLASGWFRCVVQRDVSATVHGVGSVSVSSHLSEASGDSGLPPSNRESHTCSASSRMNSLCTCIYMCIHIMALYKCNVRVPLHSVPFPSQSHAIGW